MTKVRTPSWPRLARTAVRAAVALCVGAPVALAFASVLVLASLPAARPSRAAAPDEASVHAAYVINFVRYATWPGTATAASTPYVIAALGPPESIAALKQLASQAGRVEGRRIAVRPLSLNTAAPSQRRAIAALEDDLEGVHVVYVAASHRAWNDAVIAVTRDRPVLTVGTGSDFVTAGGMFGLIESRGRVRFTVNENVIRRSPVQVSARVLMLARAPQGG